MIKLKLVYNFDQKIWELFHQDVSERIAYDNDIYGLIKVADSIAKLIKPAKVIFVPLNLMKELVINEYME